jgi:hypothetical protein
MLILKNKQMNYLKNIIFIFSLIFIFIKCTGDENAPSDESTNNICNCIQPVVKINQEIKGLQIEGNIEAITALVEKAGTTFEKAIKCAKKNTIVKVDKAKLEKALLSNCEVEERMIKDLILKL